MSNTGYGKTMENVRNRIDVRLVNIKNTCLKWTSKPSFRSLKREWFSRNTYNLSFNKSAYIGICILELRKELMNEFHYYCIKNGYCNNLKLLFTDSFSLIYEIEIKDGYEDSSSDICLILVIIRLSQITTMILTN